MGDGPFGGFHGPVFAAGRADAHDGHAGLGHGGFHVGKVQVDEARHHDEVGDAFYGVQQHFVRPPKHLQHGGFLGGQPPQAVVVDGDGRVGHLFQHLQAVLGLAGAFLAFKGEGFGHHGHRQDTQFLADFADHGGGPGAGAAAQPGGDEHHVAALQGAADGVGGLDGGFPPDVGVGPGAQAFRQAFAQLDFHGRLGDFQGLGIGVGGNEFHPLEIG